MWFESPHGHLQIGDVRIHDVIKVVELESGCAAAHGRKLDGRRLVHVEPDVVRSMQREMAIVVPTKNERLELVAGVLSAIPLDCTIVLVSASDRRPDDRYRLEVELLSDLSATNGQRAVAIHQRDPGLARAVDASGLGSVVCEGQLRPGKGEAMLVGVILADLLGAATVGFVDSDNHVPAAVHEYVAVFAAGLGLGRGADTMVRISWPSKPKMSGGRLVFNRWGRTSRVTNQLLDTLLSTRQGLETHAIRTGNAGDHAMTMSLARRTPFASGFAAEPYQLVHLIEAGEGAPGSQIDHLTGPIDVFQIETRNPHFHEERGHRHLEVMQTEALGVIYHSSVCPPALRVDIERLLRQATDSSGRPPRVDIHPPVERANRNSLERLIPRAETLHLFSLEALGRGS